MTLSQLRKQIDALDIQLLRLLNRRAQLVLRIGHLKKKRGMPIFNSRREEEVLRRLTQTTAGPLSPAATRKIFREILRRSRKLQTSVAVSRNIAKDNA